LELHTVVKTMNDLRRDLAEFEDCVQNDYGVGYYFRPPADAAVIPKGIDLEAWTRYRVGLDEWNRRTEGSLQRGLQHFRHVISRCPDFAPGHILAAESLCLLGHIGLQVFPPSDVMSEAKAHARKALGTAADKETLAAAHSAMGKICFIFDWDLKRAEQEFRSALALHPAHAPTHQGLAHVLLVTDRWPESIESINRARLFAPSAPMIHATVGWLYFFMGQCGEAAKACQQTAELHPEFPTGFFMLGVAQEALGRSREAIAAFERSYELSPSPVSLSAMGHSYARVGKPAEARSVLKEMSKLAKQRFVSSYLFGFVHAGLGERNKALDCLERAYQERCDWLLYAGLDPRWQILHNEPRFKQLLKQVGVFRFWPLR
jgi:adenylate cyclase